MKRFLLSALIIIMLAPIAIAGGKNKQAAKATAATESAEEIHWLTFAQAAEAMQKQPKKVWIDVYTSWCGWCKVMDKKTFSNPYVISYMNEHFYCIRFDAESQMPVTFMGKTYGPVAGEKTNELAISLLQGQMTYPSSVFMQENFKNPMPAFAGYLDVPTIEVILTYLAKERYKTTPFDQYQKEYTPGWAGAAN